MPTPQYETATFLGGQLLPKVLKIGGWLMIIMGIPLLLFMGLGLFFIVPGIAMLWASKLVKKQFTPEGIDASFAKLGGVIATVKKSVADAEKQ